MKKSNIIIIIAMLAFATAGARNRVATYEIQDLEAVRQYKSAMEQWVSSKSPLDLEKIDNLFSGQKIKCRINNGMTQEFVKHGQLRKVDDKQLQSRSMTDFIMAIEKLRKNIVINFSEPRIEYGYSEPESIDPKDVEQSLTFVSMKVKVSGAFEYSGTDLLLVREGEIVQIVSDDSSLPKAFAYYHNKQYDDAFRVFRNMAYANPVDFMAQYYTALMELHCKGCGSLNKQVRDMECAWWIGRGIVVNRVSDNDVRMENPYIVKLANLSKYVTSFDKLPYYNSHGRGLADASMRWCVEKLVKDGLMVYKNKNNRYGFMNEQGKIVIKDEYTMVIQFNNDGLACVQQDGLLGFIDKTGAVVVPARYKSIAMQFVGGKTLAVKPDGTLVVVDTTGQELKVLGKGFEQVLPYYFDNAFCAMHSFVDNEKNRTYYWYDTQDDYPKSQTSYAYVISHTTGYFLSQSGKQEPFPW